VFGHSEGGRAALAVEAHAAEAPELTFLGTVASAPYNSVAATVILSGRQAGRAKTVAAAVPGRIGQNFQAALMTVGLMAQSPSFDPRAVMGADLQRILPAFRAQCCVGAIGVVTKAIEAKRPTRFAGLKPGWDKTPQMRAFLAKNDFAVTPGFRLHRPILIVQGTVDTFVPEPPTTAFVARLKARGAPVTYKRYPGADHFTVIKRADADMLAFRQTLFRS
jgi:pimeloyl-ACP methyl ester carboxylesterase